MSFDTEKNSPMLPAQALNRTAAPIKSGKKLNFCSQFDDVASTGKRTKSKRKPTDYAKFAEDTFLQVFSNQYGDKIAEQRFNTIFDEAVSKNETVKAVVEALNWEFKTIKQL